MKQITRTFMATLLVIISASVFGSSVCAQITMSERHEGRTSFAIVNGKSVCSVMVSDDDYEVVKKSAMLFADDVKAVTGKRPQMGKSSNVVIAGTLGHSALIQQIVKRGKINIADIEGSWERYVIQTVSNPLPGISKALVVIGSDRRGTAYGLLSISELIGQNPWYWWADVPAQHHANLFVHAPHTASKSPSVKYRGIFINDEDWGLTPWSAKTFEPERGNIGPRTYGKICELLLRLKANYLCPAMHPVSTAFYQIPENKLVADTFAIVMGTSHCEPLFLNTASEWNRDTMGPWDYDTNKQGILNVLDKRVKETINYENVYTLALRGLHDAHMQGGGVTMKEKVQLLQNALQDQRNLIAQNTSTPIEQVPQAFTPYKEVLDIYSNGLELPEDVTIIWPDDNFGYMKRLSNPQEQQRSGRSGVYYHVSYLGVPHSYLWFSTTSPGLMYEELKKAYDTTADRVWVCNCGDLKGSEASVDFFLAMAYDIDRFSTSNVMNYQAEWLSRMFGKEYYADLLDITRSQIQLCFDRKPEYMGWGFWNNFWGDGSGEKRTDTEFSLSNYCEAESRLAEYRRIGTKAERMMESLPEHQVPAFFELVYYPVKGSELMNRMTIGGQLYRQYVRQQRSVSELVRHDVEQLHDSLVVITDCYNDMLDGKWRYVMSLEQNYTNHSAYFKVPRMEAQYVPSKEPSLGMALEGEGEKVGRSAYRQLPVFSKYYKQSHWIDIYNKGVGRMNFNVTPSQPWIIVTETPVTPQSLVKSADGKSGARIAETFTNKRYDVTIDWQKVPEGESVKGDIIVEGPDGAKESVLVSVFNPASPTVQELRDMYVENDGVVTIPAAAFTRKFENDHLKIFPVEGLWGKGSALQLGDAMSPLQPYRTNAASSRVEYDFYTFNAGIVDVYTYVLPTFPLHSERDYKMPENTNSDTKYSVRIDDGSFSYPTTSAIEYSQAWYDSRLGNCRINHSTLYVHEPGRHRLQLYCGDPGTVVQQIVIDLGGKKRVYR